MNLQFRFSKDKKEILLDQDNIKLKLILLSQEEFHGLNLKQKKFKK
jgi:hypothetical protein